MGLRVFAVAAAALFLSTGAAGAVDVQTFELAKGEEVWFVPDHTLPMIAMTASIPAGSAYDPTGKPGLAAFAADLLDEGAGKLNSQQFQTALSNRAIRLSITPDRDYLVITLVTLTENAKDAFQLLGLALSQPRFDADAIARVRAQILSGLAQQEEEPGVVAARGFYRTFYHDHPYSHAVPGNAASVTAISAADIRGFATSHWVGGGLKIAVSGDFDRQSIEALLKSAFGRLPLKSPPPLPLAAHEGQPGVQVVPMNVPQPTAVFGLPGLLRSDPEFIPAYVANYILGGGGFSSRLTDEVREKRGLTYDIATSLDAFRKGGMVLGQVASKRGAMQQTIAVIRASLRDYAANGPTAAELADAKTYLTGSFPLAFSSNVGIADQLAIFQRMGLKVDYMKKRNALIEAVTLDQVKHAAHRLFNPDRLTIVVGGNLAGAMDNSHLPAPPGGASLHDKSRR